MKQVATLIISLVALGQSIPASAAPEVSLAEVRRDVASSHAITVTGALLCRLPEINNGEACQLKLMDSETGRVFNLSNTGNAMKLYNSGIKTVSIVGNVNNPDDLRINEIVEQNSAP